MSTISKLETESQTLYIGRQGENEILTVTFNMAAFATAYGGGTPVLLHQRAGDSRPYIATTTFSDNVLSWTVTNADTYKSGTGRAEIRWIVDDKVKKSAIFGTSVTAALMDETEQPGTIVYITQATAEDTVYDEDEEYTEGTAGAAISTTKRSAETTDTAIGHWNDLYINQFLGCLKSYYDNRWKVEDTESIYTYGHKTAIDSNYTTGGTEIDCSAFVTLGLMGIDFLHSPYASLASVSDDDDDTGTDTDDDDDDVADDTGTETGTGAAFTITANWAIDLADRDFPLNGVTTHIRTAAQICQLLEEAGWKLEYEADFSDVRRGDIVFYAKMVDGEYRQPDRYKKISHVATVSSVYENDAAHADYKVDTAYPKIHTMYEVTSFKNAPQKVVINSCLEKRAPGYIVSICRPKFGAVCSDAVSGSGYALNGTYNTNSMNHDGFYYLTSSTTTGLPEGMDTGVACVLEVKTAYTRWGKPYGIMQRLVKMPTSSSPSSEAPTAYIRTNYCYKTGYVFSSDNWSAWVQTT